MDPVWILLAAIFAPVGCGLASLLLPRSSLGERMILAVAGPVAALVLLGLFIFNYGTEPGIFALQWMPTLDLTLAFNPDKLGLFFALLVSGVGLLIVLYARAYFGPDEDSLYRFYPSLLLFMTAMLGVVLADNFVALLLFWELTSVSSFLLIGWEQDDPKAVKLAMQAFVVTGAGGLAMMGGLILLGLATGRWSFSELGAFGVEGGGLTTAAFVLIFAGAAAKSAQAPLHFWLPGAMAAPTPVSAYLHSATMVKAGVYLVGRMWPILTVAVPIWPKLILPIGAVTMVYGAFVALQKTDLKKIFAYTTVSQLGLLMCMYGLAAYQVGGHGGHGGDEGEAQANLIWDVTQILNHALYKAPLFILAGAIGHIASRDLTELRGLAHRGRTERVMTWVLLAAGYALAAGPFTVSFSAKEFFFYQIWHGYEATHSRWFFPLIAAGVATGMFNVAIFLRLARTLLAKPQTMPRHHQRKHHEHDDGAAGHGTGDGVGHSAGHGHGGGHGHESGWWPAFLWIPGAVIVVFQYVGGVVPGAYDWLFGWLEPNINYFEHFPLVWNAHLGVPLYMSLTAIGLGVLLAWAPVLRKTYEDPFDYAYPGFFQLVTKGGGRVFGLVQTGHLSHYVTFVSLTLVGLFLWSIDFRITELGQWWPAEANFNTDRPGELVHGILLTGLVCLASVLLPVIKDRASRVLILGTAGFSVTATYYLYRAPDLALTQISIEIVSLLLFLLVLSLLPKEAPPERVMVVPRIALSVLVGAVMFWLTLTSSAQERPTMPYLTREGRPFAHLGEYFIRNSHEAVDAAPADASALVGGVVARPYRGHETAGDHATGEHRANEGQGTEPMMLHPGGGGNNVVNVILVDFRGYDTMGEITVLGIAALGVWTLLRRHRKMPGAAGASIAGAGGVGASSGWDRVEIPEPMGGPDPEDQALHQAFNRLPQT